MFRMNNSIKEMIGVNAVSIEITRNKLLKGEIPTNDKTVSWDGEIQVYDEENHHKSSLYGRVPVQVKARKVKQFNKDQVKYRLNRGDIQNYYQDGGVLFFVVEFVDVDNRRVYYDVLLPLDLKNILGKMKSQNSINHEFVILPSNVNALDTICRHFIINSRKQTQNVLNIDVSDVNRNGNFVIPAVSSKLSEILNYPAYIYRKEEHYNLEIPMEKIMILKIIQETDQQIGVNGEIYYTDATKRIEKEKTIIGFGGNFEMEIQYGADSNLRKLNINLNRSGELKKRIKDTKFMIAILTARQIEVMGYKIPLEVSPPSLIGELRAIINFLEELDRAFTELSVSFNQPFGSLKAIDVKNMEKLKNIILYQDYSDLELKQSGFLKMEIGNITILLAVSKENDKWNVTNAFESEKLFRILASTEQTEPGFEISAYMILEAKQLFKMENFKLSELEKSILNIEYDTDVARQYVNQYILSVITYYDEEDNSIEFLDFAKKVYEYLAKLVENDETYFLNIMQITRRIRKFKQVEMKEIIKRKNKAVDPFVICGYLALLGNLTEFEYYFSKLSAEDRSAFQLFPIYRLVEGDLEDTLLD